MSHAAAVPVLAIDGPSGSGKGTISALVAERLGWRLLDSGALYRAVGYAAGMAGLDLSDADAMARCAQTTKIQFRAAETGGGARVIVNGHDATDELRTETAGAAASAIASMPSVREALVALQLGFRKAPGLVADGRDMGTVIFPQARLKVFLTASAACRAERRYKQLISKGISANIADLRADLEARDARDANRSASPLKPAQDALVLDNSEHTIDEAVMQVVDWWQARQPFGA